MFVNPLRIYPEAQVFTAIAAHLTPFQLVPEAQSAQTPKLAWKNPDLQVHETPLK